MPSRSSLTRPEKEVARLRRDRLAENSIYPSAGPRLGVFNLPGPDTRLMPPAPPNIAEVSASVLYTGTAYKLSQFIQRRELGCPFFRSERVGKCPLGGLPIIRSFSAVGHCAESLNYMIVHVIAERTCRDGGQHAVPDAYRSV